MSILIVVSHPDDEVLGAGGSAAAWTAAGKTVRACILSGDVSARRERPDLEALHADATAACLHVGMAPPEFGPFPNVRFNTVPHLELVQFIEQAIEASGATTIVTHHPGDLNDDHRHTAHACQAAARLFQRKPGIAPLERLMYMEVPSSTDWAFPSAAEQFRPTAFVALGTEFLERKLAACHRYRGVMRPYPHPRSDEAIRGLAAVRGGQAGVAYAEAFEVAFSRLDPKG